jgi:hypothetical protein
VSKHFRIKFSPPEIEIDVVTEEGIKKLSVRKIERQMLCNLFDTFGAHAKTIREQRIAADNWANVDAVPLDTPEASVLLTEDDHKQLVKAHEISAGSRPHVWSRCREMIAQLENPTEEDVK